MTIKAPEQRAVTRKCWWHFSQMRAGSLAEDTVASTLSWSGACQHCLHFLVQDHEDITLDQPTNTAFMLRKNVFFCFVIITLTSCGRWQGGTYREVLMGRLAWLWHRINYTQTNKLQINSYPALGWTHLHLHPTSCIKQWNLLKSQFRDWKLN